MAIIIRKLEQNISKVKILFIYSLITFFLLVNGSGIFPEWDLSWSFNVIIYAVGVVLFAVSMDVFPRELQTSLFQNLVAFCASVLFTLTVLLVVKDMGLLFVNVTPMPYHLIPPNMTFNLFPVAVSEEIIFRGFIFGWLYDRFKLRPERQTGEVKTWGWVIPYLVSSALFALFHYAVYGLDLSFTPILFFMGIIFAYATERFGIGASIGAHWIWNCMALGIFYIANTGL